ncbi:hydrophobic surface binding protein [Marasmius fiardii PR-910]|nr:hydrophobic surface binding protein [Marasmius fiardii PR-910]
MVRVFAPFVALLSVGSALAAPFKRDVATVQADIATISTQVTALDSSISAFPDTGGSLASALAIHNAATTLDASLKKATTDTQATDPFSENDGQNILASVEAIEPTILHALQTIVAKKPAFDALPIGGVPALVLQDLQNLSTDTTAFADALIAKSPADLVDRANEIKSTIGDAFATAIAAYS